MQSEGGGIPGDDYLKTEPENIMNQREEYALLDSGSGRKLEKFGTIVSDRPCAQAVVHSIQLYGITTARFDRQAGLQWKLARSTFAHWFVIDGVRDEIGGNGFWVQVYFLKPGLCGNGSEMLSRRPKNELLLNF